MIFYRNVFSGVPDYKRAEEALNQYEELYRAEPYKADYLKEYILLSAFYQSLFISHDGYVIDTGNFQAVNYAILRDIYNFAKKHPLIWRLVMVC
mgnify:CR=1 FL=1